MDSWNDVEARKAELEQEIRTAFFGVSLEDGISLKQTSVIDDYGRGCTNEDFAALPLTEETSDWSKIPKAVLDQADCLAHLDRKGFRYYIPALMIRVLENYDPDSMMTIGTLSFLYPETESWAYLYSLLTPEQMKVIAHYLESLPEIIELDHEDSKLVERASRDFWDEYLRK